MASFTRPFHMPSCVNAVHAHGNQRNSAKLSHSAQPSINTLYIHMGTVMAVATGNAESLRSANHDKLLP